jgi:hypothetical protein
LAGTHLLYSKGSGFITNTLKIPVWDMYGTKTPVALKGMGNYELQPNTQMINPAGNRQIMARPMNTQVQGYEKQPVMAGLGDSMFEDSREIGI